MKFDEKLVEYANKIGYFFVAKHDGDQEKAGDDVLRLRITDLYMKEDRLVIKLHCPGRLIGMKGKQVEKLEKFLGVELHVEEEYGSIVDCILHGISHTKEEDEDWDALNNIDDILDEMHNGPELDPHDYWRN